MLWGNAVLLSTVPTFMRILLYRRAVAGKLAEDRVVQSEWKAKTEELLTGNLEYQALCLTFKLVLSYWFVVQATGFTCMGIWGQFNSLASERLASRNVQPWWMAIFATVSAFSNVGYLPFTDNLYIFADDRMYNLAISTIQ